MGSGKYGALTGAISRMRMLDNINSNLANANTSAYKKGIAVFEAQLDEAKATRGNMATNYVLVSNEMIDFTPGRIEKTGDPMHLAINGDGFFRVEQEDGEIVYARRGSFRRNAEGEMLTPGGAKLLGNGDSPVILPAEDVSITQGGSIISADQLVGSIPLYVFEDTSGLKRGNDGVFIAPPDAQVTPRTQPEILQGYLEGSNVNVMQEMGRMVSTLRTFEAAQKALTAYAEMDRKLAELGNVQ